MAIRTSEGRFLEILENRPTLAVPIEVDIFDGANIGTMLATMDGAHDKQFTRELSELGAGSWKIARNDPKATDEILAVGNLCKYKVLGTYRHATWIEEPAEVVVSEREGSGEIVKIAGRGILAYLERAAAYPPIWPPAAGDFVNSSANNNGSTGATSLTISKPSGVLTRDTLLAFITSVGGAATTPPGWKRIRNATNGTLRQALYIRSALAGEGSAYTWNWTSSHKASGVIVALRNVNTDDTTWAISDSTGAGSSIEEPSVSIPLVDGVLLGIASKADNVNMTPPSGMIEAEDENADDRSLEVAYEVNPATGDSGDRTATASGSADWIGTQVWLPSTATTDVIFNGATFGAVLGTLIDAAQARGAIPDMTYDFDAVYDSQNNPWPDTHDLTFHMGTNLLEVWRHLVTLGLEGGMTPSLKLQAYVDRAQHYEDTVILRKGRHFSGEVVQAQHASGLRTRMLVEGSGGRVVEVAPLIAQESDKRIGRREGFLGMTTSDNATTLQRAGEAAVEATQLEDEARWLDVVHGQTPGDYEPWIHYQEGDWISTDEKGTGGDPTAQRVAAITLKGNAGGGYDCSLELNSVELDALLRIQRRIDALSQQSTSTGGALTSGQSVAASGKVAVEAGDAAGYLFNKVSVQGITKAIIGDVGARQMLLTAASSLGALTDVDLATTPPTDGQGILYDEATGLWLPGDAGGGGGGGTDLDVSPSPTAYDQDFKTALSGWTAFGPAALDVANANTDLLSNLHLKINSSGASGGSTWPIYGIYRAAPATPFTVTMRITDFDRNANYHSVGLMVRDATGKMYTIFMPHTTTYSGQATVDQAVYTTDSNRASVSEHYALPYAGGWPRYLRMVARSGTDVDLSYSMDGRIWTTPWASQNPVLGSIAYFGPWVSGLNTGQPGEAFIDWIRFGTDVIQPEAKLWQAVGGGASPTGTLAERITDLSPGTFWPLTDTSGTTAADLFDSVADATYSGSPSLGSPSITGDGEASVGFDGTDDLITMPSYIGESDRTQLAWALAFSPSGVSGRQVLVSEGGTSYGVLIYLDGTDLRARSWAFTMDALLSGAVAASGRYLVAASFMFRVGLLRLDLYDFDSDALITAYGRRNAEGALTSHTGDATVGGSATTVVYHDGSSAAANRFTGYLAKVARWQDAPSLRDIKYLVGQ